MNIYGSNAQKTKDRHKREQQAGVSALMLGEKMAKSLTFQVYSLQKKVHV